jgi:TfoX/Sxy family transcriptional regulator of competence genes
VAYDVHLADRIRSILESAGEFSEKKMFGGLAFMVNGHMCCGVLKTDLVLRLTPEEAATSLRQPHTRPMDFTGKPMKSMIYVSAIGTDSDKALAAWLESAVTLARSVPEKRSARRAATARRMTSSGLAARGPAISKSASKRAARKRG